MIEKIKIRTNKKVKISLEQTKKENILKRMKNNLNHKKSFDYRIPPVNLFILNLVSISFSYSSIKARQLNIYVHYYEELFVILSYNNHFLHYYYIAGFWRRISFFILWLLFNNKRSKLIRRF